jgi:methylthioribose-1-phosphate isomerase
MHVNGKTYRAIWVDANQKSVNIINQIKLPFSFEIENISTYKELVAAIKDMRLRGAPLIGVAGAYAMWLASIESQRSDNPSMFILNAFHEIKSARPTAVNLAYAATIIFDGIKTSADHKSWPEISLRASNEFYETEVANFIKIGNFGLEIVKKISEKKKGEKVNILTHCNAGWLACGDYGTATAPIYRAHECGIPLHIWVDETRPRLQGARLTAWELHNERIPFTVIADNTGGHLMQEGMVDMVIVGADRVALNGDVANKVGTYLKALAANDNNVPFYVAIPSSTIDFKLTEGVHHIPIEIREGAEVTEIEGINSDNKIKTISIMPRDFSALNYAFDITPARFVTGLITEKGIVEASTKEICKIFPEYVNS